MYSRTLLTGCSGSPCLHGNGLQWTSKCEEESHASLCMRPLPETKGAQERTGWVLKNPRKTLLESSAKGAPESAAKRTAILLMASFSNRTFFSPWSCTGEISAKGTRKASSQSGEPDQNERNASSSWASSVPLAESNELLDGEWFKTDFVPAKGRLAAKGR